MTRIFSKIYMILYVRQSFKIYRKNDGPYNIQRKINGCKKFKVLKHFFNLNEGLLAGVANC